MNLIYIPLVEEPGLAKRFGDDYLLYKQNVPGGFPIDAVEGIVGIMDASQILPNLFVGTFPGSPEDIDRLRREGVTAVLNVQTDEDMADWGVDWDRMESYYRETGIEVRRVPVRDFDPDDLRRKLPRCVEALDELLHQGHTVYVHCNMGVNRSPSIVIAYLHWVWLGLGKGDGSCHEMPVLRSVCGCDPAGERGSKA